MPKLQLGHQDLIFHSHCTSFCMFTLLHYVAWILCYSCCSLGRMVGPSYSSTIGTSFFVPTLLLTILPFLFLPSSSVILTYFVLAVPMSECMGKHSCMSSTFPIAILNGTCFFFVRQKQSLLWPKLCLSKIIQTIFAVPIPN